jgi:undecaprenyl-diphosphatase
MIEWLESIDQSIVLFINGLHQPWLDEVMWLISGKWSWFPFYYGLLYYAYRTFGPVHCLYFVLTLFVVIGLTDVVSSQIIKKLVERVRPSHHLFLGPRLHYYEKSPGDFYRGGEFGFVSSHAANFFAIAVFYGMALKSIFPRVIYFLIGVACIVGISRIYLGVHYLSDIIGGGIVGSSIALLVWHFFWNKIIVPKIP